MKQPRRCPPRDGCGSTRIAEVAEPTTAIVPAGDRALAQDEPDDLADTRAASPIVDQSAVFRHFSDGGSLVEVVVKGLADPDSALTLYDKFCEMRAIELHRDGMSVDYWVGREEGAEKGYETAKSEYCVYYRCAVCSGRVEVPVPSAASDWIRKQFESNRWAHSSCLSRE